MPCLDGTSCRAAALRRYFGEAAVDACGQCDLCLNPPEATDFTKAAQKALSAVHRLGGRIGRGRVVDHLLGKTKDAPAAETKLSTFGIGREFNAAGWRDLRTSCSSRACCARTPMTGAP
jgi:ATP-dependent DNA helicase RecQ